MNKVILPGDGPYITKDQVKSDLANKFIGRGSLRSSTEKYRRAWGARANCGEYSPGDNVFISAEGARGGRIAPDATEIGKACKAGASIITDMPIHRQRTYNVGEREVEAILIQNNYREASPGLWLPN